LCTEEVSAVLLWIIVGVIAIGLLGMACRWVLRARSGLDSMYQRDPDRAARIEQDAQLNTLHQRGSHGSGGLGGF
jgi:hypothetical protein